MIRHLHGENDGKCLIAHSKRLPKIVAWQANPTKATYPTGRPVRLRTPVLVNLLL